MHLILHTLEHAFFDSVKILPFIFLMYLIIEYFEHKNNTNLSHLLMKSRKSGAVYGGLFGSIPQCGFSVIAADLYSKEAITLGTLIAIFVATSDEAVPIILAHPEKAYLVIEVILAKIILAVLFGCLTDLFYKKKDSSHVCEEEHYHEHFHGNCESCEGGIFKSALIHSVKIFVFIFIATFILGFIIEAAGEDALSRILLKNSFFQPWITAVIGLIPNCATSVILTQSFLTGAVTFGSLIAGLCSGAGVGLLVLFKKNKSLKENLTILLIMYLIGAASGTIIQSIELMIL